MYQKTAKNSFLKSVLFSLIFPITANAGPWEDFKQTEFVDATDIHGQPLDTPFKTCKEKSFKVDGYDIKQDGDTELRSPFAVPVAAYMGTMRSYSRKIVAAGTFPSLVAQYLPDYLKDSGDSPDSTLYQFVIQTAPGYNNHTLQISEDTTDMGFVRRFTPGLKVQTILFNQKYPGASLPSSKEDPLFDTTRPIHLPACDIGFFDTHNNFVQKNLHVMNDLIHQPGKKLTTTPSYLNWNTAYTEREEKLFFSHHPQICIGQGTNKVLPAELWNQNAAFWTVVALTSDDGKKSKRYTLHLLVSENLLATIEKTLSDNPTVEDLMDEIEFHGEQWGNQRDLDLYNAFNIVPKTKDRTDSETKTTGSFSDSVSNTSSSEESSSESEDGQEFNLKAQNYKSYQKRQTWSNKNTAKWQAKQHRKQQQSGSSSGSGSSTSESDTGAKVKDKHPGGTPAKKSTSKRATQKNLKSKPKLHRTANTKH